MLSKEELKELRNDAKTGLSVFTSGFSQLLDSGYDDTDYDKKLEMANIIKQIILDVMAECFYDIIEFIEFKKQKAENDV